MSAYDIYVFILCLIVFVAMTSLFGFLVGCIIRLTERLVRSGTEDERILKEYAQTQKKKHCCLPVILDRLVSVIICCALFVMFGFSVYIKISDKAVSDTIPMFSVVQSNSMSSKNPKNTYLSENNLNSQFDTFDIVLLYKLPPEEELALYDVVLYEVDNTPIIHRIVGIEPPNEEHSQYYFLLQGDAIENPDRFPVYYSQMRGIYRGEHIPFVGSFVAFMQSVAGYLCILLIILGMIAIPLVEKRVNAVKLERLIAIGALPPECCKDEEVACETE